LLVTGGSGLLGSAVVRQAIGKFRVTSTYHKNPVALEEAEFIRADLLNDRDLETLSLAKPEIIVHCAALTDVDYCESHPEEAFAQNVQASINVAKMAKNLGSYMVHISTDGVFDGEKGAYSEDDSPRPINSYGRSKLAAERKVSETYRHGCILRTNIIGWNATARKSMAEWMIGVLKRREALTAFNDVVISPLLTDDLSHLIFDLCRLEYEGIVHIGSSDSCSKLQIAHIIAEIFELDPINIKSISVDELQLKAKRPKNTSLDVRRISALLGRRMPTVSDGIRRMKELRDSGQIMRRGDDRS
jgi:dTDP-4-dehydrorhamnose reductase